MKIDWLRVAMALGMVLSGCASPALPAPAGAPMVAPDLRTATFTVDAVKAIEALGNRPNALWQDSLFSTDAVKKRRRASLYHLNTVTATNTWTAVLPAVSTNGIAYAHDNSSFGLQAPHSGEKVFAVCDDASGTVVRIDPTGTGAALVPTFTPLSTLGGAGVVTKSAVMLSGSNKKLYLLTSGGYFVVQDATTNTLLAAVKISSAGFSGIAPFLDYSNGGGLSYDDEFVYGLAVDGSLYQMEVTPTAVKVKGWRAAGGTDAVALGTGIGATGGSATITNVGITSALAYGGAVTVKASPVVWNGTAVFGATNGYLYRVKTAASSLDSIQISNYPIETTPACDFDASFSNITDVFMPGGDRLHWIDSSSAVMKRKAISPPLVLDKKPATPLLGTSGLLSTYAYASAVTSTNYTATDWVCATTAAATAAAGPTRWGGGTPVDLGGVTLAANSYGITYNPNDKTVWASQPSNNTIQQVDTNTSTITNTLDGSGNYPALVKTIPVGAGGTPTAVAPDPIGGGVWVTCYGTNQVKQIDAAGIVVRTLTGIPSPTAITYDQAGTAGVAGDDILWITSTTGTAATPTGALLKIAVASGTVTSFNNTNTSATAKIYTNAARGTYPVPAPTTSGLTAASWSLKGPQGVAQDANGDIWVANTWESMDGTNIANDCNFCSNAKPVALTAGYPFNVDGHSDPQNSYGADSSIYIFRPSLGTFIARIPTTGGPFNMMPYFDGATNSMWCATYRWGVDTTERIDISNYKKVFESEQTGNHWQPHWVAVDAVNNQVWVVEGDADTAFTGTAADGLDRIAANAVTQTAGNNKMNGSNPFYKGTYSTGAQPRGVACDSNGNVWVSNASTLNCTKYSSAGTPLGTYPVGATPWCVACDKFNVTWVCNRTGDTVSRITAATQPPAPFVNPHGVSIDNLQNIWVANSGDNTMTILDQTGNTVYLKLNTGNTPYGVDANNSSDVWVAATGSTTVTDFAAATGLFSTFSPPGNAYWTALASGGNAFVSIPGTKQVVRYPAGAVALATMTVGNNPQGLAVNQTNSDVWVANKGSNSVSYISNSLAATPTVTPFGVGSGPAAVAVKKNQVWVANTGANSITRLNAITGGGRAAVGTSLGTISSYTGAASPLHMAIDQYDNVWAVNSGSTTLTKFWAPGSPKDLFAAGNYQGTDGNASNMFLQYKIPNGSFGGKTVVGSRIGLTALSNSALSSETLNAATCLPNVGGSLWTGENGTLSVDWNTSPTIGGLLGTVSGAVVTAALVNVPVSANSSLAPTNGVYDFPNTPYLTTNSVMSYAVQSAGNSLEDVAHWDSVTTKPVLTVDTTASKLGPAGLRSQPTLDSTNQRVYVMGSNAVFELRYDSPANFADPAKVAYSYTQQGISAGPMNAGNYVTPLGSSSLTLSNRLATIDYDPVSGKTGLNSLSLGMLPLGTGFFLDTTGNNSVQLARSSLAVSGQLTNAQLVYDYDLGSVYIASGTSIYAVQLLP